MRAAAWLGMNSATAVVIAASCTFPEINPVGAGSGAGTTSSTASGSAGAATTTTSGMGGRGGGAGAGTGGACSDAGLGGSGGAIDCDVDKDDAGSAKPPCCGNDCDDTNDAAVPGQTAYFTKPRAGNSFDYDCNGSDDPDDNQLFKHTGVLECGGATDCVNPPEGFVKGTKCGSMSMSDYRTCHLENVTMCVPTAKQPLVPLGCH